MSKKKIVLLGEIMMRLSPPGNERFIQADEFDIQYGGSEANIAVLLSALGYDTEFVTAVPDNAIGECAVSVLKKYGVGTGHIARCGERLGIYFLEAGSSVRPSRVVYDRAHSSISTASEKDIDLDAVFDGADWFHFSGITPALSDSAQSLTEAALKAAKKHGAKISCDLNYRSKLWSFEKAQRVMTGFMKYVDVCMDGEFLLGFTSGSTVTGGYDLDERRRMTEKMCEKFGFEYAVSSMRVSHSASDNSWSACLYSSGTKEFFHSKEYRIAPIVDRVGGGDAFAGGIISGLLDGKAPADILEFGAAASVLKHTIPGDLALMSREEIEELAGGDTSGRVQR